jgi:hypothetical protein
VSGADVVRFSVTINGKPPTGALAQVDTDNTRLGIPGPTGRTYCVNADVYGRAVLDFSAGLVVSSLKNRNYYAAGTPKIVHQGASDSVDISFGPIGTYYRTQAHGVAFGPSLGVSVGDSARYLLGGSAIGMIGRSRLMLTVGGVSGNVSQLANGDHVGGVANTGTVSTSSVQRFGSFAALSWVIATN